MSMLNNGIIVSKVRFDEFVETVEKYTNKEFGIDVLSIASIKNTDKTHYLINTDKDARGFLCTDAANFDYFFRHFKLFIKGKVERGEYIPKIRLGNVEF
jgi:hypothetical protein